jgi:hypothetical protein
MKKLLALALVAMVVTGAMAQDSDEFGLWVRDLDGNYVNSLIGQGPYVPFQMYLTIHNTSVATVGGYEASVGLPAGQTLILAAVFNNGAGTNFGTNTNHLVGFAAPVPGGELLVVAELQVMLTAPGLILPIELGPSVPSSVGGEGPAYADGSNADNLITCSYITGMPHVFTFGELGPVGVEAKSLSQVKALFN